MIRRTTNGMNSTYLMDVLANGKSLTCLIALVLALISCKKNELDPVSDPVDITFGLELKGDANAGGRVESTQTPARIQISIEDSNGNPVVTNELISLIPFGSSFVSDPISLQPGRYFLTSFLVLNSGDTAIYATPHVGSEISDLVDNPLPIEFDVIEDLNLNLDVEVVKIGNVDPSQFGYISFRPIFASGIEFEIVVFEADTVNATLQTITANLTVRNFNDTLRHVTLEPGVNLVEVRDSLDQYVLNIRKDTSAFVTDTLSLQEMRTFVDGNTYQAILNLGSGSVGGPDTPNPPTQTSGIFVDSGQDFGNVSGVPSTQLGGSGVDLGDLDGDGDLDAFVTPINLGFNQVWYNDGNGFFTLSNQRFGDVSRGTDVELADLDGDGDLDAFSVGSGPQDIWLNRGNGWFDKGPEVGTGTATKVLLEDFDMDGDIDAVIDRASNNAADLWVNNGSGIFASGSVLTGNRVMEAIDIDGDNDLDVVSAVGGIRIHFNDGTGNFPVVQAVTNPVTTNSAAMSIADFDNDGDLDIACFSSNTSIPFVYYENDNFEFTPHLSIMNIGGFREAIPGDYDNDGDVDIFAISSNNSNRVYLNDGNGNFTDSGQLLGDVNSQDVKIADLNGDGIPDAFVANETDVGGNSVFFGQR